GNSQNNIDDKGYWDNGFSRYMTGSISYLSDYEPYNGGYVSFRQGGGNITGKAYLIFLIMSLIMEDMCHLDKEVDETSGILKNFITEIENLKELKVKIIRCDNGGEFKNREMNEFYTRKGIKREFSNARTPQQNRVAKRRNRTLIEAARTMLADAKLPVTFWAEAVKTACYVQNRVLRTKKVEENLHVDFLENKLIEKGAGPNWLFDIDTLTNTINYVPVVVAGTSSTNFLGTKDVASQDVKKDVSSLRYIALPNWFHEAHLESSISNAQDTCNATAPESNGNSNPTATSKNPLADQIETLTVESAIPTMDVKSAFLYGTIDEEVYFMQPPGFQDPEFPDKVYKVEKAMYGLHQAPRAWHQVTPKECHLHTVKRIFRYLKGHPKLRLWYPKESPFDLVAYSDSDYGGDTQDRKSTTRGCQFLGRRLISWQCKKADNYESASLLRDNSQGEAFPTVSGLEAGQDRENIIKTFPLLLMRAARIKLLEDKDKGSTKLSRDDAPIKGRSLETGEEAGVERSTERGIVSVPPAAEVLTVGVPTGSGLVPTVSSIFTTASVVTPYSRRKGMEKMVESDTPKKKNLQEQIDAQMAKEMEEQMAREDQRLNEQIARDAEIARIHAEKELQMLIDGLDRNNEQIEDFVPMDSKEEGERVKRKGLKLEHGSAKKIKTSEDVSKEDLKEMMQLVPVEEVYMEALQVKHPIMD
nr:putative ribonuclease H-like domain-containing protein [Tanacetum cinerariifolium]